MKQETVQEIRREQEDSLKDAEKLSTELEQRMGCYNNPIEQLGSRLKSLKKQEENEIKQREYEEELRKMRLRYEEEKKNETVSSKWKCEKDKR